MVRSARRRKSSAVTGLSWLGACKSRLNSPRKTPAPNTDSLTRFDRWSQQELPLTSSATRIAADDSDQNLRVGSLKRGGGQAGIILRNHPARFHSADDPI